MDFTWIKEDLAKRSWYFHLYEAILKCGPIPRHVAFIMDGNRRFARSQNLETQKGHSAGFEKLTEVLQWCRDLDITEVTVYAFSIENFKRSEEEVSQLMELAREKFTRLLDEKELLAKHQVSVRVLGKLSLLPDDLQQLVAETVHATKNNTKCVLNICFAYTSREEMCSAMKEVVEGVHRGLITHSDVSERVLEQCLYTRHSPHPDLLIRTSGESRLSDFLLWQTAFSVLAFVPVMWPQMTRWQFYTQILHYQRQQAAVQEARRCHTVDLENTQREKDVKDVLSEIEEQKSNGTYDSRITLVQRLEKLSREREERVEKFIKHVDNKFVTYIEELATKRIIKATCN